MPEPPRIKTPARGPTLGQEVGAQARRKLKTRRTGTRALWAGLGMSGLIGWSVAVPTLLGTGLGLWLDQRRASGHSWTLSLLVAGLCIGSASAWHWVAQSIEKEEKESPAKHEDEK